MKNWEVLSKDLLSSLSLCSFLLSGAVPYNSSCLSPHNPGLALQPSKTTKLLHLRTTLFRVAWELFPAIRWDNTGCLICIPLSWGITLHCLMPNDWKLIFNMFCPLLDVLVSKNISFLLLHLEKQVIFNDYFEILFITSGKSFWKLSFNKALSYRVLYWYVINSFVFKYVMTIILWNYGYFIRLKYKRFVTEIQYIIFLY